jgi:AcrR family transcriptional regulator
MSMVVKYRLTSQSVYNYREGDAMPETSDKRQQLREERRKQILGAALAVFSEKGFHAANVSDVAARAGVSQGTIYWYFDSKEDLISAAILSFVEELAQGALAVAEMGDTASEKLRGLAASMEQFTEAGARLFTMFLEFWASSKRREEAASLWMDLLVEYKDIFVGIVEEGIRTGEFRQVDAEGVVWGIMAAYDGLAAYAMLKPDLDIVAVSQALTDALLAGLLAERPGWREEVPA